MDEPQPSLLSFPCEFPIKVMGLAQPQYAHTVLEIIARHAPGYDASTIELRSSREGKYLSLTVTIHALSRQQLDALYQELCDHPMVTMVL